MRWEAIYPSISIYLSIHINLLIHPYQSIYQSIYLSILSIYQSINQSIYPSIYSSHLSIYLSIRVSASNGGRWGRKDRSRSLLLLLLLLLLLPHLIVPAWVKRNSWLNSPGKHLLHVVMKHGGIDDDDDDAGTEWSRRDAAGVAGTVKQSIVQWRHAREASASRYGEIRWWYVDGAMRSDDMVMQRWYVEKDVSMIHHSR